MKRYITILILLVCLKSTCMGDCSGIVKTFYLSYMNNILQNNDANDILSKTYLTEELLGKVDRLRNATGIDPIIRAQDVNEDAVETVLVERMTDDWYLVKYFWKKGDPSTLIDIPLKVQGGEEACKITYITPIWKGSQYGDELLSCKNKMVDKIDQTSELLFLRSFYDIYLSEYCDVPKDLSSRLYALRVDNLSAHALEQFKKAERESLGDGLTGYDVLIDNFDFDCLWHESIKFMSLGGNNYQMTYKIGGKVYKIVVAVKKENNAYLIDGLCPS